MLLEMVKTLVYSQTFTFLHYLDNRGKNIYGVLIYSGPMGEHLFAHYSLEIAVMCDLF